MSSVVLMDRLSALVSLQLHIYLRGLGIEDTTKWSRQGCKEASRRRGWNRGQNLYTSLSLTLSSLTPFSVCRFSHPIVLQRHRPARSPLSEPTPPGIPPPLFTGMDACVWHDASACVSVIIVCSLQHSPPHALHVTFTAQDELVAYSQGRLN